jgi:cytochrome o ubiquinol oxidase subunit IV
MSSPELPTDLHPTDIPPGIQRLGEVEITAAITSYLIGLGLATLLTVVSFFVSGTTLVWTPSIPVALAVLAVAQMGVHLVFFLHIGTGRDNVNNVMALAFGVLIVFLVIVGSLWIMANMNANMASTNMAMDVPLERKPRVRIAAAEGVIAATATTPIAARVSGVIQSVACNIGMRVHAGQVCAKIDPRPYRLVVDRSRAELRGAEARLEKDKSNVAVESSTDVVIAAPYPELALRPGMGTAKAST